MMTSRPPDRSLLLALLMSLLAACSAPTDSPDAVRNGATVRVSADAWADNWFAFYLGDRLVHEDGVSIETERSFNAESFEFEARYPMQLNVVLKDFRENDTGLEYIGQRNQQMGDGGFIAQFKDAETGRTIAVTDSGWKCLVVHRAPLDKACEGTTDPVVGEAPCEAEIIAPPAGWTDPDFDDSAWTSATEFSAREVDPKGGYDEIDWDPSAQLVWTSDLEADNTLLCRLTVGD